MGEKPFRALAIDGGGMLGFYSAALLRALTREFGGGGDLGAKCNLLCGASAGALIACALAAGVAANDIVRLFQERGRRVFPRPMPRGGGARTLWWAWRHRRRAAADAGELRAAIDSALGEETFAQVYRRRGIAVCAPAIDIDSYQARIFRTPHSAAGAGDADIKMIDACLAGAAAILFFPPHSIAGAGGARRFAARRFAAALGASPMALGASPTADCGRITRFGLRSPTRCKRRRAIKTFTSPSPACRRRRPPPTRGKAAAKRCEC